MPLQLTPSDPLLKNLTMANLPGSDSQRLTTQDYLMEAEKNGFKGEVFLHYIQEQEKIRRDELQSTIKTENDNGRHCCGIGRIGGDVKLRNINLRDKTRVRALCCLVCTLLGFLTFLFPSLSTVRTTLIRPC